LAVDCRLEIGDWRLLPLAADWLLMTGDYCLWLLTADWLLMTGDYFSVFHMQYPVAHCSQFFIMSYNEKSLPEFFP
jgi:hypothetical protein